MLQLQAHNAHKGADEAQKCNSQLGKLFMSKIHPKESSQTCYSLPLHDVAILTDSKDVDAAKPVQKPSIPGWESKS